MTALLVVLGGFVGIALLMVMSSILNGYALSVLWGWFIVPTFGVPQLSVVSAIGIAMVVSYLTYQIHDCKRQERSTTAEIVIGFTVAVARPLFALFFGYIVHLFM